MAPGACKFYVSTALGRRCVLLSPEDWRKRRDKLRSYCERGGNGCPVLRNHYSREKPGLAFLCELRRGRISV